MNFQFQSFNDFLAMGGHGSFVWACYGLVLASIVFGIVVAKSERKKLIRTAKLQQVRQAKQKSQ